MSFPFERWSIRSPLRPLHSNQKIIEAMITLREKLTALIGHTATNLWIIPSLSKWIHRIRGVQFKDPATVFIGKNVLLDNRFPKLVSIGNDVWLTANTIVLSHYMYSKFQRQHFGCEEYTAPVIIEDGVFIGCASVILPGVTIGRGSYIGANSTVTTSIPPDSLAVGSPAKVIKKFEPS